MWTRRLICLACLGALLLCPAGCGPGRAEPVPSVNAVARKASAVTFPESPKTQQAARQVLYSGNVNSRIYHNDSCRHFSCKNCTVTFSSAEKARQRGYKPCSVCGG